MYKRDKKDVNVFHSERKTKEELFKYINILQDKLKNLESIIGESKQKDKILLEKEHELEKAETELLRMRNRRKSSLEKYADLYDAPIGYLSLNEAGIITGINLTGAFIFGKQREKLINLPFISLLRRNDAKKFFNYLNNCRTANTRLSEEFILNLKTNEMVTIKIFTTPFRDYKTRKLAYRAIVIDDSARIKAEKALKESEIRFSYLADNVPVLIWMFNKNRSLEYINMQRFRFTGLSVEQESSKWFENVHPLDREIYRRKYNNAFNLHKKFTIEYRLKNQKNNYHWFMETTIPRFGEENEFLGLIGTSIDITERKKVRTAVENSLKEKETLVKEIHHRVKNNLQIVSSLLNLQSFYIKDPKVIDLIKVSQERIRSMALVHEKLYRSKDLLKINFEEYAKDLVSNLFQSYRKNINIRLKINISRILLEINIAISLGLILNELVSNSLKHAFNGRKEGEISIELLLEKRNTLELIVSDDGVGLPKDFDIFKSEGMGLELVESLIQQHHGSMDIIRDGKTEFRIYMEINKQKTPLKEIKSSSVS